MFCTSVSLWYLQLKIFIKVSIQIQQFCLFVIRKRERFNVLGWTTSYHQVVLRGIQHLIYQFCKSSELHWLLEYSPFVRDST